MGLTVALGTDSLAGNDRLSMRAELRRASGLWPNLDPEVLLRMATHSGGMALSRKSLGRIRVGGPADFLVVALGEQAQRNDSTLLAQFTEGFVDGQLPVAEVHLAGQRHRSHWPGRG